MTRLEKKNLSNDEMSNRQLSTYDKNVLNNLVKKAQDGDDDACLELIERYMNYIYKLVKQFYINGYEVEDLVQLGILSLIKAIHKYDTSKNNFTTYVTLAIKNNFYYLIRKEARNNSLRSLDAAIADGMELEDIIGAGLSSEDECIRKITSDILIKGIEKLPPNLKEIILYVYILDEGSVKKYADERGMNYSTAVKRRKRAVSLLSEIIEDNN